jgi:hypothetical protein
MNDNYTPDSMVWTMAKVGTVSFTDALSEAGVLAWQAHWLSGRGKKHPHVEYPTGARGNMPDMIERDLIPPSKIIIPVREPVARSLSSYMQSRNRFGQRNTAQLMFEAATQLYKVEWADEWFEKEIGGLLHFDPYQFPFNHQQGYQFYEHGKHTVVIIRLEDANRVFPIVTEILYDRRIEMPRKNAWRFRLGANELYQQYEKMKAMPMPAEYLDRCYNLKYARHFYSEEERKAFREGWENGYDG